MDKAVYKGKTLRLASLPREKYEALYEAALRGQITCTICGDPVQLYLGIQQQPHFYHEERHVCSPSSAIKPFEHPEWRKPLAYQAASPFLKTQPIPSEQQAPAIASLPLDASQLQAVQTIEGPLLVLAGAGSGKTRVLTARTAYMIGERNIPPSAIMLVTFTAKAANEMKARLLTYQNMNQAILSRLVAGTFHSIFYRMLVHFHPQRWHSSRLLKWEWQKEQMIKEAGRELDLDEREFAYDQALQQISYWKNTLATVERVRSSGQWEERVLYLYKRYEEMKRERGLFDFDDMLLGCYEMLTEQPSLLARYQDRFRYFLIDEFQDINRVQYDIINMLCAHTRNLCAVGDDDQAIYSFRGSDPSFILEFDRHYPEAKVVALTENYRSSHHIVEVANTVISRNRFRRSKQMRAQFADDEPVLFFFPYDEEEEATMVVEDIKERLQHGAKPSDFAILYRTHTTSRAIFERLVQAGLPFVVEQDGESFYQRRFVRYLLAYLRLSLDPNHEEAINDLLVSLFLKQSLLQEIKAVSILEDCSLLKALTSLSSIYPFQRKKLKNIFPFFKSLAKLKPIEAIEMIETEMGFSEFLKKRGNEGNVIEKGSDDIRDVKVVAKKFKTVPAFLKHVDTMMEAARQLPKQKTAPNAIQLSTIHRAKGLEYPYVYVLGAVEGSIPHDYAMEANRNGDPLPLEEERRLLYVAITRAKRSLHLSVPAHRRMKTAQPSRFLKELVRQTTEGAPV
ncbi:UvrD-helicase domain-containing protein [Anoxybacillus rupiensis]|uniref:UvrD-helicase domain-containing protein n=1 Tax=Anoxybacteroides rupiense TaxID=311460 RepID=UPI001BA686E4|nr:ATP-dependent helicase [Anoxybacillus rupiensis]MBS2770437.1 UvrD-helicase domain-containing protein [Anoxybacillus rupiensis]